jgi:hypothetical protein
MRTCPYCGQQAISAGQKATLGPLKSVTCQSCGKPISVSWLSIIGLAAFLLGGAAALWLGMPWGIAALIAGVGAMFTFHELAVPLVGRT